MIPENRFETLEPGDRVLTSFWGKGTVLNRWADTVEVILDRQPRQVPLFYRHEIKEFIAETTYE